MEQDPPALRVEPQETGESMEKLESPLMEAWMLALEELPLDRVTTTRFSDVCRAVLPKSKLVALAWTEAFPQLERSGRARVAAARAIAARGFIVFSDVNRLN
jgi:hypothetical protein